MDIRPHPLPALDVVEQPRGLDGKTELGTDGRVQLDYQMLVEQLPGAVYRACPGAYGAWSYVSPKVEKITGVSALEFESNPELWLSLIHPGDREAVLSVEDRVAATGEPYLAEYRMVRPDGSIVWVRDEAVVLRDAGESILQGVLIDITDRKNVELEMESSLSLLQATLEATADGILVVDPPGKVLGFNQRFLQLWGIPDELARSGDDESLLSHVLEQVVDPAAFLQRIQELYDDPDSEDYDVVEFKDGRVYERFSIPRRVGGESVGRVWSFRDRTGERAAAEQRERLEEQLSQSQKLEAIGRLAGGVAHDFNNALTVIANYARFISEGLQSNDRFRDDAAEIIRASDRAASLVKQLLAFSRKEVVRPRVLDLNEVIVEIERLLLRTIGEDIEIRVNPIGDPVHVLMDPGQIEQILLNLGLNARDAMPDGGVLTVASSHMDLDRQAVASMPDLEPGCFACLVVSDTGAGMDAEVKAHIFEPFFTTKGRGQGTGLGLASVYGIVKQAGGHVAVESESGTGTTFSVYLPVTNETPVEEPRSRTLPPTGAGERILVVEDEEPVRRLVSRILEGAGYEVFALASGLEAIDAIRPEAHYDLLLTDVVMPGMSGVDLANRLTAQQSGLKVLLMSGYAGGVFPDQGASGRSLLLKPFDKEELLTRVRELLGNGSA